MLENIELVVRDTIGKLEELGFESDEFLVDRFFKDEWSRKLILKDSVEICRTVELSVRYNYKDNEFTLDTTWSNIRINDNMFKTIVETKGVIDSGNGMLHQYD